MATQITADSAILAYIENISEAEDDLLRELRELTAELPGGSAMQVPPSEARLLAFLVRLTGATTVLELGTFTGYSTLAMARALPRSGRLITCDISKKVTDIGVDFWRKAGVDHLVDLRLGDALGTLETLEPGSVDVVFIDADKRNYAAYYDRSVTLLRSGGLIVVDNTLFFGRVADPDAQDADTVAVRELNERVRRDDRVDSCVLPVADGITLARKAG